MNRNEYLSKINMYAYPLCTFCTIVSETKKKEISCLRAFGCVSRYYFFSFLFIIILSSIENGLNIWMLFLLYYLLSKLSIRRQKSDWKKKKRNVKRNYYQSRCYDAFTYTFCFYLFYDFHFYLLPHSFTHCRLSLFSLMH